MESHTHRSHTHAGGCGLHMHVYMCTHRHPPGQPPAVWAGERRSPAPCPPSRRPRGRRRVSPRASLCFLLAVAGGTETPAKRGVYVKSRIPLNSVLVFLWVCTWRWPFAPSLPSCHPGCFAVDGCWQRGIQRCWLCSARRGTSRYWTGRNILGTWQKQAAALRCPHNAASGDSQNKPKIVRRVEPSTA